MFTKLKEFFNFNATERNGILVLIFLIVIVAFIPKIYRFFSEPEESDFSLFQKEIESFEKNLSADDLAEVEKQEITNTNHAKVTEKQEIRFFPFDPNHLPEQKWQQLGLKDWQVRIIKKYESKGGKFRSKEDLKKIYGITPAQYESLESYIVIHEGTAKPEPVSATAYQSSRKSIKVDINIADTMTLQELRGIGPAFARRIARYREMLGGFYFTGQLLEVYGFDQKKYELIASDCLLGEGVFRKINLNTTTTAELKKHPYLDYYIAKAIVDRRIAKGNYSSVTQLKEISLISDELYEKISHYCRVE